MSQIPDMMSLIFLKPSLFLLIIFEIHVNLYITNQFHFFITCPPCRLQDLASDVWRPKWPFKGFSFIYHRPGGRMPGKFV